MNVTTVAEYVSATTTRAVSVEKIAHKLVGVPAWMMNTGYYRRRNSSSAKKDADVRV